MYVQSYVSLCSLNPRSWFVSKDSTEKEGTHDAFTVDLGIQSLDCDCVSRCQAAMRSMLPLDPNASVSVPIVINTNACPGSKGKPPHLMSRMFNRFAGVDFTVEYSFLPSEALDSNVYRKAKSVCFLPIIRLLHADCHIRFVLCPVCDCSIWRSSRHRAPWKTRSRFWCCLTPTMKATMRLTFSTAQEIG